MAKKKSNKKSSKHNASHKKPQRQPGGGQDRRSSIRLSQCMIVKNEEKNIERALSWGKGIVCEQIVVDTGSTDRTVEIAEGMGAKVLHFEWIDDFAAAKNHALEQATGDWIAFLDADEYFPPEDAGKLLPLLEQAQKDNRIDIIRCNMAHTNSDGKVTAFAPQDRILRNDPNVRYRYRIHEQPYHKKKEKIGCFEAQEYLVIIHTGYNEHVNRPEKGDRNARLLERDLAEDPTNAIRLMYLGDAYNMADREIEALDCYRRVLWDPEVKADRYDDVAYLRSGLQILRLQQDKPPEEVEEEAYKVVAELSRRNLDFHPDMDYYVGFMHLKKQELDKAAMLFERALGKLKTYSSEEVSNMTNDLALPNYVVAGAALQNGDAQKAVQFSVSALQANKYSPDGMKFLLLAFATEHKPGMSVEAYWEFLYKLYNMNDPKDLLFIWKMSVETGFRAMEDRAFAALPPELQERASR